MKKAYLLIFDTHRSEPECRTALDTALGELSSRSSVDEIIKLTPEQLQAIIEELKKHEPKIPS